MIKAIILDVDGVIVGDQPGVNFPLPNKEIIQVLKNIRIKNIPIILCTVKFNSEILDIIKQAHLNNPHITDNGALTIDPINNGIIKKHVITKDIVRKMVKTFLKYNIYLELYSPQLFYIQKTQVSDFTLRRTSLLQTEPIIVDSLFSIAKQVDIIKMICYTEDDRGVSKVEKIISQFDHRVSFLWSFHKYLQPAKPCIITSPNVSKADAVRETVKALEIPFDEILGVGDSLSDWNFMKMCKYVATLENGDERIKELAKTKGEGNYFIATHINNNGIVDILKHFFNGV